MKLLFGITLLVSAVVADIDWSTVTPRHVDNRFRDFTEGIPRMQERITNGEVALPRQFPYQVGLMLYLSGGRAWCGGTLISDRWIVTAAHCTEDITGVEVFLGATNRTDKAEVGQQNVFVSSKYVLVHEDWDRTQLLNDISLIKLPAPIEFNEHIQPAKLPKMGETSTYAGEKVIASGWGKDSDSAKGASEILRWIEVPIMDNVACNRYYFGMAKDTNICISTKGKKSTCNGDSGGPLVLADGSNTLIGATSFGISLGCEVEYPGVFTRITSYLDWIKHKTQLSNE